MAWMPRYQKSAASRRHKLMLLGMHARWQQKHRLAAVAPVAAIPDLGLNKQTQSNLGAPVVLPGTHAA